jgi:ketosteroid isomerase-like protein
MRLILVIAALVLAISSPALAGSKTGAAKAADVEQALMQMERDWFDAYVKRDAAALERIEADDYMTVDPSGMVSTKAQDIDAIKSGKLAFQSGTFDDMKVRVYGDAAVVTARVVIKGSYMGQDISGAYRGTDVFVKRGGRWQAVSSHVTRIADQPTQ